MQKLERVVIDSVTPLCAWVGASSRSLIASLEDGRASLGFAASSSGRPECLPPFVRTKTYTSNIMDETRWGSQGDLMASNANTQAGPMQNALSPYR